MKPGLRRAESGLTDDFIADAERLGHYPECSPPSVPVANSARSRASEMMHVRFRAEEGTVAEYAASSHATR
jgi:hypothetical protein